MSSNEQGGVAGPLLSIPVSRLLDIAEAAGRADQPLELFRKVEVLVGEFVGHRLFSVSAYIRSAGELQRRYSSNEAAYPVGGRKSKKGTFWADLVLERGEPFLGNTPDDIRDAFDDHARILGLGLRSVINVPLRWAGATVGTMNLLDSEQRYGTNHVLAARSLGQLLLPALIAPDRSPPPPIMIQRRT